MNEIIVSKPQEEILTSTKQRNLSLAGQGGGKSHTGGLLSADFVINYPNVRGFIGANTYSQLSKSTLDRVFNVWKDTFGWIKGKEYVVDVIPPKSFKSFGASLKSYENTISFDNGAIIFTASLDNYKVIDGTQFGWAILDETKDTAEEAVKEVITARLREKGMWVKDGVVYTDEAVADKIGAESWNPLYVLTSPAKVPWINDWFGLTDKYEEISKRIFSKTDYFSLITNDKHIVIYSAYHNEDNLPKNYIEQRKKDLIGSPNLIDMLIYGSPIAKAGGEFFIRFERLKHVGKVPFNPDVNVHISLDFNVAPYITMTCWHITAAEDGGYDVGCFDEFCLAAPKNNTEDLCNEFKKKYVDPLEAKGKRFPALFYYGDASGQNKSTLSKEHNFDVVERVLFKQLNENSKRVERYNTSVVAKKNFVNKCYAGGHPIRIMIDERCKNLIADNEFLKEAPDGGMLKTKVKDAITGATYEKFGHCFVAGTMILTDRGNIAIEKIKKGDFVLTRFGYKPVLKSWMTQKEADVNTYDLGITKITCTNSHRFYANGLFKAVYTLILKDTLCIFEESKQTICKRKLSYLRGLNFTDTQTQKTQAIESITKDGLLYSGKESKYIYIELFGSIHSVQFRKAIIYTIRTVILPIIILKTLSVSLLQSIYQIILKIFHRKPSNILKRYLKKERSQRLLSGTSLSRDCNGTKDIGIIHLQNHSLKRRMCVSVAEKNINQTHPKGIINFVRELVENITEQEAHTLVRLEDVFLVIKSFLQAETEEENIAPQNAEDPIKRDVYNLQIAEKNEYFANGMLVHNCGDTLKDFICSAFAALFEKD